MEEVVVERVVVRRHKEKVVDRQEGRKEEGKQEITIPRPVTDGSRWHLAWRCRKNLLMWPNPHKSILAIRFHQGRYLFKLAHKNLKEGKDNNFDFWLVVR